jgi:hypothetical protein
MSSRYGTSNVTCRQASASGQSALTQSFANGEVWPTSYVVPASSWTLHKFIWAWRLHSTFSSETLPRALPESLFTLPVTKILPYQIQIDFHVWHITSVHRLRISSQHNEGLYFCKPYKWRSLLRRRNFHFCACKTVQQIKHQLLSHNFFKLLFQYCELRSFNALTVTI